MRHSVLFGEKITGKQQKSEHAAVNEGIPVRTHRVVGCRQEFVKQIENVKVEVPLPLRCGKGAFSKAQRIVCADEDDHRDADGKEGIECYTEQRFDKMQAFVVGVVALVGGMSDIVEEKVKEAIKTYHVADIEIAEQRAGEQQGIKLEFARFDE